MDEKCWAEMHRRTAENIAKFGRQLMGVVGSPGFTYTIGHSGGKNLPEMIVLAGAGPRMMELLNLLGNRQAELGEPLLGEVNIGGRFPVRLVRVRDAKRVRDEFTCQVFNFYRTEDYEVTQVLVPDQCGRFPGEEGCEEPYASFEVL